jgi:hypothetical protein
MIYLFQAILLVAISAYAMRLGPLWFWSNLGSENSQNNFWPKLVAAVFGFALYSLIDYPILDHLMLIPGTNYVIA